MSSKLKNVRSVERNSKELLDACKNPEQVETMFELLHRNGLCAPTNVILGSILRAYLKRSLLNRSTLNFLY